MQSTIIRSLELTQVCTNITNMVYLYIYILFYTRDKIIWQCYALFFFFFLLPYSCPVVFLETYIGALLWYEGSAGLTASIPVA
jgi:hypothetical protein